MTSDARSTHPLRWNLLFVAAYVPTALLGLALAIPPGNVTPVYPAAGLAFGAYLWLGPRILPGIFLGGVIGNLIGIWQYGIDTRALSPALMIGLGEVLSVMIGAALLRRLAPPAHALDSPRRVLWLFTVCLLWVISPSIGVGALALHGLVPWSAFDYTWITWWLGDAIGLMLVTPLLLVLHGSGNQVLHPPLGLAATALGYTVLVVALASAPWPISFVLLPATMVMVLRHGVVGAAVTSTLCAVLVVGMVLSGSPLYGEYGLNERLLLVQALIGVNAFTGYFLAAHVRTIARLHTGIDQAREESERDHLTGLLNRRGFERNAGRALQQHRQADHGLALVMLDIDDFKTMNDSHGHDFGDRVLAALGKGLHDVLRTTDHAARLGGDEFALLLDATSAEELRAVCDRVIGLARELTVDGAPAGFRFSLSGGIAFSSEAADLDGLTAAADRRLYQAKQRGKDQVVWPV